MSMERRAGKISEERNKNKSIQIIEQYNCKKDASRPATGIEDANRT